MNKVIGKKTTEEIEKKQRNSVGGGRTKECIRGNSVCVTTFWITLFSLHS
jgi:hypothetical protein